MCDLSESNPSPSLSFKYAINLEHFIQKVFIDDKREERKFVTESLRSHLAVTPLHCSNQSGIKFNETNCKHLKPSSAFQCIGAFKHPHPPKSRRPTKKRHSIPMDASFPLCAINAERNLLDHTQSHQKVRKKKVIV